MTELLIAFSASVITTALWLIIHTKRIDRLRSDIDLLSVQYVLSQKRRPSTIINTSEVVSRLRAGEALRNYQTKQAQRLD